MERMKVWVSTIYSPSSKKKAIYGKGNTVYPFDDNSS